VFALAALLFRISFPATVHRGPLTGRVYVIATKAARPDPRIQVLAPESAPPIFGKDVSALQPQERVRVGAQAVGYPLTTIRDLPAGEYYVEAVASVYTRYHRSDGHSIWAPAQWGPQVFTYQPGNLYSPIQKVNLNPRTSGSVTLTLSRAVTQQESASAIGGGQEGYATDTPWIEHVRIESRILTKFWGSPIYLGATVLLPKGYATHSHSHYPIFYRQGHFEQPVVANFTTDRSTETAAAIAEGKRSGMGTGYEFYEAWNSAHFPRVLAVTFQHPCPFFDDSYAVNSANCGPYGDAIMQELIPYVETHFRVLREPRARVLAGGSTGGWESLALQCLHSNFFGGAWIFQPDPIDFSAFQLIDLYTDANAFHSPDSDAWHTYFRPWDRTPAGQVLTTVQQLSRYEEVLGSNGRSGYQLDGWWAIFDPTGANGYPLPLWSMQTGMIDRSVVDYARDRGYDLAYYLRTHWPQIGSVLSGKLHFFAGDMDSYYLNLAVYKVQTTAGSLRAPPVDATFFYGRPLKGHDWIPITWYDLIRRMAVQVHEHAPTGESDAGWNY
jgi:hypothetical protein